MTDDKPMAATAWLLILKEGGRWTAGDVSRELGADYAIVASALRDMDNSGAVRRWEADPQTKTRLQFGVTAECRVPRGIKLSEIMECKLPGVGE